MTREEARKILTMWMVSSRGADGQRGYIEGWFDKDDVEAFRMAIKALSADRPTGWIPVSERLPDIGDTFLVTVMAGTEITTDVANTFGSYIDGFWDTFNDWVEDEEYHVIAWMPLPEPYKGGDTE